MVIKQAIVFDERECAEYEEVDGNICYPLGFGDIPIARFLLYLFCFSKKPRTGVNLISCLEFRTE